VLPVDEGEGVGLVPALGGVVLLEGVVLLGGGGLLDPKFDPVPDVLDPKLVVVGLLLKPP
jgi:hypothetical protein